MTDADVDGAHIRTLLLTFFFRYARDIISVGRFILHSHRLYLIKKGSSSKYAYNDKELEDHLRKWVVKM